MLQSHALTLNAMLELTLILFAIEMPFGAGNKSVVIELPLFVSANANAFPSAAWSGVGSG